MTDRDLNDEKRLTVEWRKLHTFITDEDGDHELIFGKRLEKESTLCIRVMDDKKSFSLGDQIVFTVKEFSDITWGLFAFGSNLVQTISATGEKNGLVKPLAETAQPENQPDGK